MPQGYGLTTATQVEVISAYGAAPHVITPVLETPGWYVIGTFFLPLSCNARLDVLGQVSESDAGNALHVRLFDMEENEAVSGATVTIAEMALTRRLSGVTELQGQRTYQIQAEYIAEELGEDEFAVVHTATLSD